MEPFFALYGANKGLIYSSSHKSLIFCFAQLLLQILVNYQNQGQIWNLLVLTFSKHPLHVQFDQVLAEIFEVKDTWYHSFIFMIIDLTKRKTIEIWTFWVKSNWWNILDLWMVFLKIILFHIGTFDVEQNNFWIKLFRFLFFSSSQINSHENKRMVSCVFNLKYLSQNLVKLHM